jgi:O-acetyl-ADP-ribose deacetylase (regulator of RNase III)
MCMERGRPGCGEESLRADKPSSHDDLLRYRIGAEAILELTIGDITNESTDAIVNAANSSLLGGGGVDGAIHDAAGPDLLAECKQIRQQHGPLPAGQAVSTSGANLPARYVIHTVGPVWRDGSANEPEILASCYRESLRIAAELACTSISFPSISTGAFGYPVHDAAKVALRAVAEVLQQPHSVTLTRFVLFDPRTHKAYAQAAQAMINIPEFQIKIESSA